MEAQPNPGRLSVSNSESLPTTQWQVQVGKDSPIASDTRGSSLESHIRIEVNRQCFLRGVQRDIAFSMNAYLVGLVLLASVTFVDYLQPPGGLNDSGQLKETDNPFMTPYITSVSSSFHLAVTGILVCMSCMAFVIPDDRTSTGSMLVGEMITKFSETVLNVSDQKMLLSMLVKTNSRVSLALKVARLLVSMTKILFVSSLASAVMVFETSMFIVLPEKMRTGGKLYGGFRNQYRVFSYIFSAIFLLYALSLLLNIISSVIDTLYDIRNRMHTSDAVNTISACFKNEIKVIMNMNLAWIFFFSSSSSSWIRRSLRLFAIWSGIIISITLIVAYCNYILDIYFVLLDFNHSLSSNPSTAKHSKN